jgi:hypothetical protein
MDLTLKANGDAGKSRPKSEEPSPPTFGTSTSGLPSIVVDRGDWQPPTTIARCDSCILTVEPNNSTRKGQNANETERDGETHDADRTASNIDGVSVKFYLFNVRKSFDVAFA